MSPAPVEVSAQVRQHNIDLWDISVTFDQFFNPEKGVILDDAHPITIRGIDFSLIQLPPYYDHKKKATRIATFGKPMNQTDDRYVHAYVRIDYYEGNVVWDQDHPMYREEYLIHHDGLEYRTGDDRYFKPFDAHYAEIGNHLETLHAALKSIAKVDGALYTGSLA